MGLPSDASNDLALCRLTLMAQQWAKSKKLDLSIKPMTESSIGYSQSSYPELDSQIKAARTRVLLEYVTNLALCLHVKICFDWLTDIFELKNKQKKRSIVILQPRTVAVDAVSVWHLVVVWNDDHVVMAAMAYQMST